MEFMKSGGVFHFKKDWMENRWVENLAVLFVELIVPLLFCIINDLIIRGYILVISHLFWVLEGSPPWTVSTRLP